MNEKLAVALQTLKQTTLFASVADEVMVALADQLSYRQLKPHQLLFQEGDPGDALYLVVQGHIKIFTRNALDEVTVLQQFGPGAHFGEMSLIDQRPRSASAMAVDELTLLVLQRDDFLTVLAQHPLLALSLLQDMAAKLRTTTAYVHKTNQSTETTVQPEAGSVQQQGCAFISYSRKDVAFVRHLYQGLTQSGIDTWVDWKGIPLTADWWAEIESAIKRADAFAFVISPDSLASEVCQKEIATAIHYQKRFIPILHRPLSHSSGLPEQIARHNWVLMRDQAEMEQTLPDLVQAINTDLAWVHLHSRLLTRAIEWDRNRRDPSFTLRGVELARAERWLAEHQPGQEPPPTRLHLEYLQASRQRTPVDGYTQEPESIRSL
jgi:CRP-like cAMP-binding protein